MYYTAKINPAAESGKEVAQNNIARVIRNELNNAIRGGFKPESVEVKLDNLSVKVIIKEAQ